MCTYKIQFTDFCHRCIDRQIAVTLDVVGCIENVQNHADEKRSLAELQRERQRQQDELDAVTRVALPQEARP